jgi:hypothetical protein
MPFSVQLDDVFGSNMPPRRLGQPDGSSVVHPCGRTAQTEDPEVEGSTRIACGGVPSWTVNEDHGPSLPSLQTLRFRTNKMKIARYVYQFVFGGMPTGARPATEPRMLLRDQRSSSIASQELIFCEAATLRHQIFSKGVWRSIQATSTA